MKRTTRFSMMAPAAALLPFASAFADTAHGTCSVSLTQDPLVMRVGKDEFRVAFGLDGSACKASGGCSGTIRYNATWQAEDGTRSTVQKAVAFEIPQGAERSLSVDRGYFDNGEALHTTELVAVGVDQIRCDAGAQGELASR